MELYQNLCKNCGGDLHATGDGKFKCAYCGSIFEEKVVVDYADEMRKLFDEFKLEAISNARKNLYSAVTAEYISSQQVHEWCMALKQYLPDDFQANFYETAIGANGRKTAKAIRKINVKENAEYIETIIKFLIVSLKPEFISEVCDLIARAYKLTDLVKFREYSTKLSVEAEKLDNCIYLTNYPRDVFVAYSSRDMEKVLELVECLEEQGLLCFIAARNLRHGAGAVENYEKALREAMDNCQSFVFVSSTSSRNPGCDALRQEIPYIKSSDIENAPHELRNNYANIPQKYKKHRVEYRIEESPRPMAADRIVSDFFSGYERVYTPMDVAERVLDIPTAIEEEAPTSQPIPPASVKYCITCLNECPEDAKFCMNCGGNTFANTPNEAKLMQQIAALQNADKERIARESAEREAAERARREEELARRERELAERARREEELARRERELAEKEQREAEERARREREAAERAKHDAEERAKREAAEGTTVSIPKSVKVGDIVKFGRYQQDSNPAAGKKDIEWQVLDVKDGRALVISKYGLDCKLYHETYSHVTWATCALRKWLNNEFLNSAFSASEIAKIPAVTVTADKTPMDTASPGNPTWDKVFLLSITEAKKYFSTDASRACKPTDYAIARGAYKDSEKEGCWWWLRSPGRYQDSAAYVSFGGDIYDFGFDVNLKAANIAIRPSMWVECDALTISNTSEKDDTPSVIPTSVKVGDVIRFGKYQQSGSDSAKEDVEWIVLDKKDGRALVISKYVLDCHQYHHTKMNVTWESCSLRKWLNNEFLNSAFSASEIAKIPTVTVSADLVPTSKATSGNNTQDKIFLLSFPEAKKYFNTNEARIGKPTSYAVTLGAGKNTNGEGCRWWLRSPGYDQCSASNVGDSGGISTYGSLVNVESVTVRPAMWLELGSANDEDIKTAPVEIPKAEERAKREAEERAKREAEERAKREAEERAKREAEERAKREAEEKAKREAEERARHEAAVPNLPKVVKVGDVIQIGRYKQDADADSFGESIDWIVLDVKDGRALVISKYGLDCKKFNNKSTTINWKGCTLRKWLNEDFINSAFSQAEAAKIPTVTVSGERNPSFSTDPCSSTSDRVFLLSVSEAKKYFSSDEARICKPTAHAIANGLPITNPNEGCTWWLRTPGGNKILVSVGASNGKVSDYGTTLDNKEIAVRPAMWLELDSSNTEDIKTAPRSASIETPKVEKPVETYPVFSPNVRVGDIVKFGRYKQESNSNDKKPLEWRVLEIKDGKALVLSKYGIDCQKFNQSKTNVSWQTSSIRTWLNSEFISTAFSDEERMYFATVSVTPDKNPSYGTNQGAVTQDKVFLLSISEVYKYFTSDAARKCNPTPYAVSRGSYIHNSNGNCCFWWLRTSGGDETRALDVTCGGDVGTYGGFVDQTNISVRPAIWVSLFMTHPKSSSSEASKSDEIARREAEEKARREAEEKARLEREAAERAKREAEEKARLEREAAERARREAAEKARLEREAEEKARLEREAAERARRERESKKTDQPVKVGDVVRFGKYKQSTRLFAGKTDIEWIVLDVENCRSLLISKYGLDCQQFNASGNPTTWERCSLRRWLNGEFLSNAFSKTEIAKIKTSKVQAHKTPNSRIDPGKPTQDMVFLLSFQEATKYFYPKETLVCKPTDYAISCGIYVDKSNGACRWLLRSPGYQSKFTTFVNCDGQIDDFGVVVDNYDHTIRPAMWVDLRP